jgi:transketolase
VSATMRERFLETASDLLDEDPRVAVVLADISASALAPAAERHPDRVINVGIREQLMVSVAGGLALEGLRPIAHSYTPFVVERPFEQVKLDLGHQDVGAILVSVGASYDSAVSGRTHQAPEDVALMAALPGWRIVVPGHADEVPALLRAAVGRDDRTYLRLTERSNAAAGDTRTDRMRTVRRGALATVVAVGPLLDTVLDATAGLDVTVLHAITVRPFDAETLRATLRAPTIVLVEPYLAGTSAAEVSLALGDRPHRLLALGVRNIEHRRYGTWRDHDAAHGLDAPGIRSAIERFLQGARPRDARPRDLS